MSAATKEYILSARKFAAQFKGFISIAEELEKIESFELAIGEVQQRLAMLREEEEQAIARGLRIIEDARAAAVLIENEAKDNAQSHLDGSHESARSIIASATTHAHDIVAQADRVAEQHAFRKQELEGFYAALAAAKSEHADVLAKTTDAWAEHARVTQLIADLKAKF